MPEAERVIACLDVGREIVVHKPAQACAGKIITEACCYITRLTCLR